MGLTLEDARRVVLEQKESRPDYGPVPQGWRPLSVWKKLMSKWQKGG
jgi:hypothetical protein